MTAFPVAIEAQAETFRDCFGQLRPKSAGCSSASRRSSISCWSVSSVRATRCSKARRGSARRCSCGPSREALDLRFARVQCTPDLMPADITGTNILVDDADGRASFAFQPGPIFANIVLADEINRATPRTQAAFLEAMQERHGHAFGSDAPARRAVLRVRHAEPDRDGGHLSAARGAARSVLLQADRAGAGRRRSGRNHGANDRRAADARDAAVRRRYGRARCPADRQVKIADQMMR